MSATPAAVALPPRDGGDRAWLAAASLLYGLLLYLLLPAGVVALDDDFGYLRSVVRTLQAGGWPRTDDWLAPWSASLSMLAGWLYRATGSFQFAIHGLLAACGALAFWGTAALLRARGFSTRRAMFAAALLLTFPTVLWKSVEFTGVALCLPCLVLALGAAEGRRWGRFLAWCALALATRQSALAWLALPAAALVTQLWPGRPRPDGRRRAEILAAAGALLGGLALFFLLNHGMNKTHAQAVVTDHTFAQLAWRDVLRGCALGGFTFFAAAGAGACVLQWSARRPAALLPRPAVLWLALPVWLLLLAVDVRAWVSIEHPLFSGVPGWLYTKLALSLALAGWVVVAAGGRMIALRPGHALAAGASIALVSLRSQVWDYYLLDVAVFGFFGVAVRAPAAAIAPAPTPRWLRAGAVALLEAFHLLFLAEMKIVLDRGYALGALSEQALRARRLEPAELSFAPFGFTAWQLYPWFIAHEGRADPNLAGFDCYLRPGAVEVGQGYSRALHVFPRFRHEPPADRRNLLAAGRSRFLWCFHAEYFLLRFKTARDAPAAVALPPDYRRPPFPLNDAEWRELIAGTTPADPATTR